jgi:hypothetical protein
MFRTYLKNVSMVVGALVTLGGAVTGVVTGARALWGTAKDAGSAETVRENRLSTVEGTAKELKDDAKELKGRVGALEAGQEKGDSRMQRIEDSQGRSEELWRDVKSDLKELRRERR